MSAKFDQPSIPIHAQIAYDASSLWKLSLSLLPSAFSYAHILYLC